MNALSLSDVIRQVRDLPALSTVVMELLQSIDQEDIDIDSLAGKVSHDQALTAKTLRLANSSFYGMQRKVTTIHEAIAVLGFRTVRSLITTAALTGSFSHAAPGDFDFAAFWRHSIATAVCAKLLARQLNMNQEYAFTAGLLHDIGRLVMVSRFPAEFAHTLAYRKLHDCFMIEAEAATLGFDHATVGQALAEHWKFPISMQLAVARHHHPDSADAEPLAAVIHLAEALAHALDFAGVESAMVPMISEAAWNRLDVDRIPLASLFSDATREFEGACLALAA